MSSTRPASGSATRIHSSEPSLSARRIRPAAKRYCGWYPQIARRSPIAGGRGSRSVILPSSRLLGHVYALLIWRRLAHNRPREPRTVSPSLTAVLARQQALDAFRAAGTL